MTISIPTRETAAATVGPRLDISPADLRTYLEEKHGLSNLISNAKSWEPFAWKGNDLSSPMRALWVAEELGLLDMRNGDRKNVMIDDITVNTNEWLRAFGKREITTGTTLNALRKVSKYVSVATGCSIIADSRTMGVRFVNKYENAENVERYYSEIRAKLVKLGKELDHAEQNEYDVSKILANCESDTRVRLQLVGSAS